MANVLDRFRLDGHVALVTGAGSGIGRAIGEALAQAGAAVVLCGRRAAPLAEAQAVIAASGARAASVAGDVGDRGALAALAGAAAKPFGTVDIVVHAAGLNHRQHADDVTDAAWDEQIEVMLSAPFFLTRHLVAGMKAKGWGRVLNIASLQSYRAFVNGSAYGAAKGGIVQLTRHMAEAWSPHGINCNAIAPGFFPTALTAPVYADPQRTRALASQTAIGRNGALEDLHGAAVFLCSPASDYVTGQTLPVDGGFTAK
ncbi:MAG TPA: SDR family oxidoreductase [Usitatibacter sp.]|nr:SDR family oxidoreductase [Usitatibacter sp.]